MQASKRNESKQIYTQMGRPNLVNVRCVQEIASEEKIQSKVDAVGQQEFKTI